MENTNNKIITLSFMVAGILTWLVLKVLVETVAGMVSGSFGRALNTDFAMHVLPVLVGAMVFSVLQFNKKVVTWGDDVVAEIRKIVWPSKNDTVRLTIAVCVFLVLAGLVAAFLDAVSSLAIDALLNFNLTI